MTTEGVATLKQGVVAHPVQIRALRRWTPQSQTYITCYIFVDKFGAAIQAIAHGSSEQNFAEAVIKIGKCYEIHKYACIKPLKYINALAHAAHIRIGASTLINPIDDNPEIQHFYFNFGNYDKIREICDNKTETTDYFGILDGPIQDKNKRDGDPFIAFNIIDSSNEVIPVTLWKEIATVEDRFNREDVEKADYPVIIALTAMKAVTFSIAERPQLQSTSNTFVFLNPKTPETEFFLNRLEAADVRANYEHLQTTTISDLLEKSPSDLHGITFSCDAIIQQITSTVDWYRNICPACSHEILNYGQNWMCPTEGEFERPVYMYQVTAILQDNTRELEVTINHDPATTIIGTECSELRITSACRTEYAIPIEITSTKGRSMTFHLQAYRERRSGKLKANVQRVISIDTQPTMTETPTTSSPQQTPAPTTPQIIHKTSTATKRLAFGSKGTTTESLKKIKSSQ